MGERHLGNSVFKRHITIDTIRDWHHCFSITWYIYFNRKGKLLLAIRSRRRIPIHDLGNDEASGFFFCLCVSDVGLSVIGTFPVIDLRRICLIHCPRVSGSGCLVRIVNGVLIKDMEAIGPGAITIFDPLIISIVGIISLINDAVGHHAGNVISFIGKVSFPYIRIILHHVIIIPVYTGHIHICPGSNTCPKICRQNAAVKKYTCSCVADIPMSTCINRF